MGRDFSWLAEIEVELQYEARPRPKHHRIVSTERLVRIGIVRALPIAGQGGVVMPGPGDVRPGTRGDGFVDVHLNAPTRWKDVPAAVWAYTLGGYQVLKKWLSYREQPLLGRPLHEDEARYFAQVVRRIAAILLLGPALDASYAAILPSATGLPE